MPNSKLSQRSVIHKVLGPILSAALCLPALAETEVELRTRVISTLRLVDLQSPPAPGSQYQGDGDPRTIEVIHLRKRSEGPSRVSEDGQVVYLGVGESTSKHKEKLLERAFEIHFRKARASGPISTQMLNPPESK